MSWLAGKRVLITRAAGDLAPLAELLRARGAEPVPFPCIELAPPDAAGLALLDAALDRLVREPPAALALASPHAVESFVARLRARGLEPARLLANVLVGAAGASTARALAAEGIAAVAPEEKAGAASLARLLIERLGARGGGDGLHPNDRGAAARVLLPQAAEATPALADGLRAAGLEVDAVVLYRTASAARSALHDQGLAMLRAGALDAITFASGSAARGFVDLLGGEALALARPLRVACMGDSCAAVARALGLAVAAVGARGLDSMLDALDA